MDRLSLRCPVCRAAFRGTRRCSRCGADLTILMSLAATARLYREQARKAIESGDFQNAGRLAGKAQKMHATEHGRRLLLLSEWLGDV
ncbi:MAG: hypothetical protein JRH18_17985 [Deltaproteobacteria bacterium]|nr:hypothetical protein [Deltaproteobacteria bacterium]MBW1962395.1 hypothetical protein [Deltaproteobacteria bacterium]MBW2153548.1 hypothetical protein [Deltaproteobacteria bacterium]